MVVSEDMNFDILAEIVRPIFGCEENIDTLVITGLTDPEGKPLSLFLSLISPNSCLFSPDCKRYSVGAAFANIVLSASADCL